jgi:hypothetical protein
VEIGEVVADCLRAGSPLTEGKGDSAAQVAGQLSKNVMSSSPFSTLRLRCSILVVALLIRVKNKFRRGERDQ